MKDFTDRLDRHLRELAAAPDAGQPAPWWRSRLMAAVAGLGAALAAGAAALVIAVPSHAELPILRAPTQDIQSLRDQLPVMTDAGMQFEQARYFGTAGGRGFALTDAAGETLCIAIPDPGSDESFGTACQALKVIEHDGLAVQLIGNRSRDPRAVNTFAFVLPDEAGDVRLEIGGREAEPVITHGIVTGNLQEPAVLSWRVGDREGRHRLSGPDTAATAVMLDCGDGRSVTVEAAAPMDSAELARERRKRC